MNDHYTPPVTQFTREELERIGRWCVKQHWSGLPVPEFTKEELERIGRANLKWKVSYAYNWLRSIPETNQRIVS